MPRRRQRDEEFEDGPMSRSWQDGASGQGLPPMQDMDGWSNHGGLPGPGYSGPDDAPKARNMAARLMGRGPGPISMAGEPPPFRAAGGMPIEERKRRRRRAKPRYAPTASHDSEE